MQLGGKRQRVLVINPNTTKRMTEALEPLCARFNSEDIEVCYFTAPEGPSSINNGEDCHRSAELTLPHIEPLMDQYDAFLVACYSDHPLADMLRARSRKPCIGIFEASLLWARALCRPGQAIGIVSTGKVWEKLLGDGVERLAALPPAMFKGVQTTGLSATELHDVGEAEVRRRMKKATRRLVEQPAAGARVAAICLGCAGMSGMDEMVREAVSECDDEQTRKEGVHVVDGVMAGVATLAGMLRSGLHG